MPFLRRCDVSLYYEMTEGELPPVLLLHGWCCDHTFLAPQANHFAGKGHAVVSLDFRGHGQSDKPEQAYPIGGFTEDVAWICEELKLEKPIVVGHSMGGIVACDLAGRWPDLPCAIIMLDAAVVLPAAALAGVMPEVERLRASDYATELRRVMNAVFFLPTDNPERREHILAVMTGTPQHVIVAAYEGLAQYASPAAGRVTAPSLYIAADEASPRSDMPRLRTLLPAMLFGQTVGSGHFCQLEVPEQVNAMIDRFLTVAVPGHERQPKQEA
jgi:pimeloyl-ACP methyl ester carboxylesterase